MVSFSVLDTPKNYVYASLMFLPISIFGHNHWYSASLVAQSVKNLPAGQETYVRSLGWESLGSIPRRRKWQTTPVFLPGESHGQRSLVGCSPWGCKASGMTEQLTPHWYSATIHPASSEDVPEGRLRVVPSPGSTSHAALPVAAAQLIFVKLADGHPSLRVHLASKNWVSCPGKALT